MCECCHPICSGRQACGRTSWGHTGGRSHRISPPSVCGACLYFSLKKYSAVPFPRRSWSRILCNNELIVPPLLGIFFFLLWGKISVRVTAPRFELTSQRQKVSWLPTEPSGRSVGLQLEKLRWNNKSAIDISNANPTCGHKEVRRSTGHIMVTTRYPDQQGSKSRQKLMRLYKQWHRPMPKRFTKPPYSISRAPSIDSNCCRLPMTSVLSNKTNKLRSNQFWLTSSSFSRPHTSYKNNENWNTEVHDDEGLWLVMPACEPASSRPKPCASLEKPNESCPFAAPSWPSWEEKGPWSDISFSLRNLPVRAFDSHAQGFSPPLARRQSSCPPPSPNLVRIHPIERYQALRDSVPCFSRAATPPEGHQIGARKRCAPGNTILSQPYRRRVSTDRLNCEGSQLAASLEGDPGPTPAGIDPPIPILRNKVS